MTNKEKALLIVALENTMRDKLDESILTEDDCAFVTSIVEQHYRGIETEEDGLKVIEDMADLTLSLFAELKAE